MPASEDKGYLSLLHGAEKPLYERGYLVYSELTNWR